MRAAPGGSTIDEAVFTGNWNYPATGAKGTVRVTLYSDRVEVRGRFADSSMTPYSFALQDIATVQEARVFIDPGVSVGLVSGDSWRLWSRRNWKPLHDALHNAGATIVPGVHRVTPISATRDALARWKRQAPRDDGDNRTP